VDDLDLIPGNSHDTLNPLNAHTFREISALGLGGDLQEVKGLSI